MNNEFLGFYLIRTEQINDLKVEVVQDKLTGVYRIIVENHTLWTDNFESIDKALDSARKAFVYNEERSYNDNNNF